MNAADLEALRAQKVAEEHAQGDAVSADMKRVLRAELLPTFDAAGFTEAIDPSDLESWGLFRAASWPRVRKQSTARGFVTLGNQGTPQTFAPGALVLENVATSKRYRAMSGASDDATPIVVGSGASNVSARIESEEPGDASSIPSAVALVPVPSIAGFSAITHGSVLGADAMTASELRAAVLNDDALSVAVRDARRSDASIIGANRVREVSGVTSIASVGGSLTPDDLRVARAMIQRPRAQSAAPRAISIVYSLEVLDGLAPPTLEIEATIAARLAAHLATLPLGPSTVWIDAIDTAIRSALGLVVRRGDTVDAPALVSLAVSVPAADVALGTQNVIGDDGRTYALAEVATLGSITPTIARV